MGRVHEVLHWANRRAVAEEVTRRGYRVSGETLNRWVRDEKEFPAVVERIVFELFGIGGHNETAPPWAGQIEQRLTEAILGNQSTVIEALERPEIWRAAERVIARLEALEPPGDAAPNGSDAGEGPAAAEPPDPVPASRHGRDGR